MTIIEDKPIHSFSEDQYGREHLVEALASTIQVKAQGEHSCYTIGIYGPWGEGKTSVLNMIQSELLKLGSKDEIHVCRYNPWMMFKKCISYFVKRIRKDYPEENTWSHVMRTIVDNGENQVAMNVS